MLQVDSAGHDKVLASLLVRVGTAVSSHTASNLDYVIGATLDTGDNSTLLLQLKQV
ncbi:MAG: hypothetical protein CM15mP109_07210 [Candidatus Dadabacteria bacterium]|nr:MAG: hypothetical protein CM15mP109_07210 [Candidatus Dadabacteria bacterium]